MAKRFDIIFTSIDSDGNTVSKTLQAKAGAIDFTAPDVAFEFPPTVSPRAGGLVAPHWGGGSSRAFAYCQVVPTPSDRGTGRFLVQYYYNSGVYPNNPSRRFHQTFDGSATTLVEALNKLNTTEIDVNAGGGVDGTGFASSTDVSGLRKVLVISSEDQSASTGEFGAQDGTGQQGFRLDQFDEVMTIYNHNLSTDTLETLRRLQIAQLDDGTENLVDEWPVGSYVFFHPYHYAPLYENNDIVSTEFEPHVSVIEEGAQYPLTGQITVAGTTVTGQFTRFDTEIGSGVQNAIRFGTDQTWYLISGVLSSSGMTIYDYSDSPTFTDASAEVATVITGSGFVTVLPNLEGCADWDIDFQLPFNDGDLTPDNTSVLFEAETVEVSPGGAPSGLPTYDWTVDWKLANGDIVSSGYTDQGSSLVVNTVTSITNHEDTAVNVSVQVSGAGQPACLHTKSTGFINLVNSVNAGVFGRRVDGGFRISSQGNFNVFNGMVFQRDGSNPERNWFHEHLYVYAPKEALIADSYRPGLDSTIKFAKGAIDTWPDKGTIVLYIPQNQPLSSTVGPKLIYCTYTGKNTTGALDSLTGIVSQKSLIWNIEAMDIQNINQQGAGFTTAITTSTGAFAWVQTQAHWPKAIVTGRPQSPPGVVNVDDVRTLASMRIDSNQTRTWYRIGGNRGPGFGNIYKTFKFVGIISFAGHQYLFRNLDNSDIGQFDIYDDAAMVWTPWKDTFNGLNDDYDKKFWLRGVQSLLVVRNVEIDGVIQPSNGAFIDHDQEFTLRCHDLLDNLGDTDTFPTWTRTPLKGRLVITHPLETFRAVIEYSNYDVKTLLEPAGTKLTFYNCKIVPALSSPNIREPYLLRYMSGVVAPYKELELQPVPFISSDNDSGLIQFYHDNPGIYPDRISCIDMMVAQIHASDSDERTFGNIADSRLATANGPYWEEQLPNFPNKGIPQADPIHRRQNPSSVLPSTPGSQGCVHGLITVTVKPGEGEEITDITINKLTPGMQIYSSDGFQNVDEVMPVYHDEAYMIATENGDRTIVTGDHPVCVAQEDGDYKFRPASELKMGQMVLTVDGFRKITELNLQKTGRRIYYDVKVNNSNDFYAGGILLHNKSINTGPASPPTA